MFGGVVVSYKLEDIDIDRNKTAENVRDFLDGQFQTYLNRAGLHRTDLSSTQLDPTGVTSHGGNSAERKMMKIFDYEAKCMAIYAAIDNCQENPNLRIFNRSILYDSYILLLENWQIEERLGLSSSRLREKKRAALCEFADRLPVWAFRKKTKLPDLHAYSNQEREVK